MSSKYDDIIGLPRHVSDKRSPMTNYDRAAQFSPFAALTGYEAVIAETGRLTQPQIELDEGGKALLDEKLRLLQAHLSGQPRVSLVCFRPDRLKAGGEYVTVTGHLKKIDTYQRCLILAEGDVIDIDRIYGIECDL